jgi:K+-sensing histidine kinase KdpD
LLDNALKYGRSKEDGVARIKVSGRRRGKAVELIVRDEGPGVPQEALERLAGPLPGWNRSAAASAVPDWGWPWCPAWQGAPVAR